MKKFMFMIAAVAAFCFTSCSNEDVLEQTTKKDLKINVTVADIAGDAATRAVKTGWVAGDKINIWFQDGLGVTPDLVITYDGSAWVSGKIADAVVAQLVDGNTGVLSYFYEGYNDLSKYTCVEKYGYNCFVSPRVEMPSHSDDMCVNSYAPATPLIATEGMYNDVRYTYNASEATLTLNLNKWKVENNIQIVVTGLEGNPEDWGLKANEMLGSGFGIPFDYQGTYAFSDLGLSYTNANYGYMAGVANEDGVAFHFVRKSGMDFQGIITLMNLTNGNMYKFYPNTSFTIYRDSSSKSVYAAKVPFSKFEAQ